MKNLTSAQYDELLRLESEVKLAEVNFNRFVFYLQKEHDAKDMVFSPDGRSFIEPSPEKDQPLK